MSRTDRLVHVEPGNQDEVLDLQKAHAISQALEKAYPNYFWLISFTGHNLIVRNLLIANAVTMELGKEGFASLLPRDKIGTVEEAEKIAVKFAGALLEAFKLPRGAWDGVTTPVIPDDLRNEILRGRQLRGWGNR